MTEIQINEEDVRKHYKILLHLNQTEIRGKNGQSEYVSNEEDFVKIVRRMNQNTDVYVGYNERKPNSKQDDNVISCMYIPADIDNIKVNPEKITSFLEFVKTNGLKYSLRLFTGGGNQFYFPIPRKDNSNDVFEILAKAKKRLGDSELKIDGSIYNPERILRIAGTYNYKHEQLGRILEEYEVSDEDKKRNFEFFNSVELEEELKYDDFEKEYDKSLYDERMELIIKNPQLINKEGLQKVQGLFPNLLGYLRATRGIIEGDVIAERLCEFWGHSKRVMKGWENKNARYIKSHVDKWFVENNIVLGDGEPEINPQIIEQIEQPKLTLEQEEYLTKYVDHIKTNPLKSDSIIKISNKIPVGYLKIASKEIFRETEKIAFLISDRDYYIGKVVNKITDFHKTFMLARASSKEIEKSIRKTLFFFDEPADAKWKLIRELPSGFNVYQFYTRNKQYFIFTKEEIEVGEYTITGTEYQVTDFSQLGEKARLKVNLPVIFAYDIKPSKLTFNNHQELFDERKKYNITKGNLFNFLFSRKAGAFKGKSLRHPYYFEELVAAFLFSSKYDGYPLHLMIVGDTGTGKSSILDALDEKMNETQRVVEGSNSTFLALVPSFKQIPPQVGALIIAVRVVIVDEFLRILQRIDFRDRDVALGALNPLLEHKEREFSSANGRVKASMAARLISGTNGVYGCRTMPDMCEKIDNAFLSRELIWFQDKEHIKKIRKREGIEENSFILPIPIWLSFIDYLQSFESNYNLERVKEVFSTFLKEIPDSVRDVYESRYFHHIKCVIDGIIKTRCLTEMDGSFEAKEEDYNLLIKIWRTMIESWNGDLSLAGKKKEEIEKYLTREEKYILKIISERDEVISEYHLDKLLKDIPNGVESLQKLKDLGLIKNSNNKYFIENQLELGELL